MATQVTTGVGPELPREVTGFDGTYEEAVEMELIERPPPMVWNSWQRYRKLTGSVPTEKEDGPRGKLENRAEAALYLRVMKNLYGPTYKDQAAEYLQEHPGWMGALEASPAGVSGALTPAPEGLAGGPGATAPATSASAEYVHLPDMDENIPGTPPRPGGVGSLMSETPDPFHGFNAGSDKEDDEDAAQEGDEEPPAEMMSDGSGTRPALTPRTLERKIRVDYDPGAESMQGYVVRLQSYAAAAGYLDIELDQTVIAYQLARADMIEWLRWIPEPERQEALMAQMADELANEPPLGSEQYPAYSLGVKVIQDMLHELELPPLEPATSQEVPGVPEAGATAPVTATPGERVKRRLDFRPSEVQARTEVQPTVPPSATAAPRPKTKPKEEKTKPQDRVEAAAEKRCPRHRPVSKRLLHKVVRK